MKNSGVKTFAWIVSSIILAAVACGLYAAGSPSKERARKTDQTRVSDLQQITYAIDSFYNEGGAKRLPQTLEDLRGKRNVYVSSIQDPKSKLPYSYLILDESKGVYQLCADFEADSQSQGFMAYPRPAYVEGNAAMIPPPDFWSHGVGQICYTVQAQDMTKRM